MSDELPIVQELESLIDPLTYIMPEAKRQEIIERAIATIKLHNKESYEDVQIVAKFMLDHGFSTGHGESIPDLLGELSRQIFEMRQGAK